MAIDIQTLVWHVMRDHEYGTNKCDIVVTWVEAKWSSKDDSDNKLYELYMKHGTPGSIEILPVNGKLPVNYRCNICGGLVEFDGTPPDLR